MKQAHDFQSWVVDPYETWCIVETNNESTISDIAYWCEIILPDKPYYQVKYRHRHDPFGRCYIVVNQYNDTVSQNFDTEEEAEEYLANFSQ